jgi:hypothetical protein
MHYWDRTHEPHIVHSISSLAESLQLLIVQLKLEFRLVSLGLMDHQYIIFPWYQVKDITIFQTSKPRN